MPLSRDNHLLEVATDVVVRFKAHQKYGSEEAALKALRRRVPDSTDEDRLAVFHAFSLIYEKAVGAIGRHRVVFPGKPGRAAEPSDIDFDACLAKIDEFEPGEAFAQKTQLLNWVIFWHYLK